LVKSVLLIIRNEKDGKGTGIKIFGANQKF